jgi:hypothetical protein
MLCRLCRQPERGCYSLHEIQTHRLRSWTACFNIFLWIWRQVRHHTGGLYSCHVSECLNLFLLNTSFHLIFCRSVSPTELCRFTCRAVCFSETDSNGWYQSKCSCHSGHSGSVKRNRELCRGKFVASKGRECRGPRWGNLRSFASGFTSVRAHMVHWSAWQIDGVGNWKFHIQ